MAGEQDKIKRLQVVISATSYSQLQADIQFLKEQGQTDMSLSRFAREALRKHYQEVFGRDIDLGAENWGGPRETKDSIDIK